MSSLKNKVKEFKMEVNHLNQKQLSTRWNVSEANLVRWRCGGFGPRFVKMMGQVLYRLQDIEDFEITRLRDSTCKRSSS
jgi:putative heme degradation protein